MFVTDFEYSVFSLFFGGGADGSKNTHPEDWKKEENQKSHWNIALLDLPNPSTKKQLTLLVDHFALETGQTLIAVGWDPSGDEPKLGSDIFSFLKIELKN